jgi:hypothetical protein
MVLNFAVSWAIEEEISAIYDVLRLLSLLEENISSIFSSCQSSHGFVLHVPWTARILDLPIAFAYSGKRAVNTMIEVALSCRVSSTSAWMSAVQR